MKKLFSFILIAFTLMSCVLFSACGDKYKKLKMQIKSIDNEVVSRLDFSIENGQVNKQTIEVVFSGIDKEDIGQIKASSYPTNLIEDSNYRYDGNSCFIDIVPIRSTKNQDAKLTIKHFDSGSEISIDLNIDEKAESLDVLDKTYIVSIPDGKEGTEETEKNIHKLDFSKLVLVNPETSTDTLYFTTTNNAPAGVKFIEVGEDFYKQIKFEEAKELKLYTGFEVSSEAENGLEIELTPVTIYRDAINIVEETKPLKIKFKKILTDHNFRLAPPEGCEDLDLNAIDLIANDNKLQTITLELQYHNNTHSEDEEEWVSLLDADFFEMYDIVPIVDIDSPVNVFEDANKKIVVQLPIKTNDYKDVEIKLVPKGYVGDLKEISKTIRVKGVLKSNKITITKNSQEFNEESFNIFDYYSDGNSLGTEFKFTPQSNTGEQVDSHLNQMVIMIDYKILYVYKSEDGKKEDFPYYTGPDFLVKEYENPHKQNGEYEVCSTKYAIIFHKYSTPLKFYFDEELEKMISEPFTESDKIFIKYHDNGDRELPSQLAIEVKTINTATKTLELKDENGETFEKKEYPHWESLVATKTDLSFTPQPGVASMNVIAGKSVVNNLGIREYDIFDVKDQDVSDINQLWLNRNTLFSDGEYDYIYPKKGEVRDAWGGSISSVDFKVKVVSKAEYQNPLTIEFNGQSGTDLEFKFANETTKGIKLVYGKNTSVGEYEIIFKQDDYVKKTIKVVIYQELTGNDLSIENNIELEEGKAINNQNKIWESYNVDYIVAAGEKLTLSVKNLPKGVLESGVVVSYKFRISSDPDNFIINTDEESPYVGIEHGLGSPYANLYFKKGVGDVKNSVTLQVSVQHSKINILGVAETEKVEVSLDVKFYIYERITRDELSLNHTSQTKYYDKFLGALYKDLSKTDIEVLFADDDLKQYVTNVDWSLLTTTSAGIKSEKLSYLEDSFKSGNIIFERPEDGVTSQQNVYIIKISQFNEVFELRSIINLQTAVLTEKLRVQNVEVVNQEYEINLKVGETYTVQAENISGAGKVTFPETIIQVFDSTGNASNINQYFEVNQTLGTVKAINITNAKKFKLVIFAKDVLVQYPSSGVDYSDLPGFIMEIEGDNDSERYKQAYFVMNITLSDGTEDAPYRIYSSEDFWQIDDSNEYKTAYWKLMKDITLQEDPNKNNTIRGFVGNLNTESGKIFVVDGIKITGDCLFDNFGDINAEEGMSEISNIRFVVEYDIKSNTSNKIGLFNVNNGTLTDVSVVVSGSVKLSNLNDPVYVGGLVGVNNRTIEYTNSEGVAGEIEVEMNHSAYVGGLAGRNNGEIIGCETSNSIAMPENAERAGDGNWVVLESVEGRDNALSQIEIKATTTQITDLVETGIGGVVGYNAGAIHNGFVNASIIAPNISNIGGAIGRNVHQTGYNIVVYKDGDYIIGVTDVLNVCYELIEDYNVCYELIEDYYVYYELIEDYYEQSIYNLKSTSTILGKDNVGGISGSDTNGLYVGCDFQIVDQSTALIGKNNLGGIVGKSNNGKFYYCSTMSYTNMETNISNMKDMNVDIESQSGCAGGIVGLAGNELVVIAYSSANAYIKSEGSVGGLVSINNETASVNIYTAYFIGKIEGDFEYSARDVDRVSQICVANENDLKVLYNNVYSINIENENSTITGTYGTYNGSLTFFPTKDQGDYWGLLDDVNANYIFVEMVNGSKKPIFDIEPESLEVEVADGSRKKDKDGNKINNVLFLEYYDFSQNKNLNESQLLQIDKRFNRTGKSIYDYFSFTVKPYNIGEVVIKVESSDKSVVRVNQQAEIEVMGVGECELTFSLALNPKAEPVRINIVVDYPIGDKFEIATNKSDDNTIVGSETSVSVGFSTQYYVITEGKKLYTFAENSEASYSYKTRTNPNLNIKINSSTLQPCEYLKLGGIALSEGSSVDVNLDSSIPFVITTIKKLESDGLSFSVTVKPYRSVMVNGIQKIVLEDYSKEFKLFTAVGPTNVSFNITDAIVYPNDLIELYANIETDKSLGCGDVFNMLNDDACLVMNSFSNFEFEFDDAASYPDGVTKQDSTKRVFNIKFSGQSYGTVEVRIVDLGDFDGKKQIVKFEIVYLRGSVELSRELTISTTISTKHGYDFEKQNEATATFTLIPQRINKLEIKNYYYKNEDIDNDGTPDEKVLVKENVLKSNEAGKIQIDIVPDNGYYDYLEISDITGDQEIVFTQIYENGNAVNPQEIKSSDGKGIVLTKVSSNPSTLYVRTQIDKTYNNKTHTIEVRAYSAEGKLLGTPQKIYIDVKMLPSITVEYLKPDGSTDSNSVVKSDGVKREFSLANGVDAEFRIKVENSNTELKPTLSGDLKEKYNFVNDFNGYYTLKRLESPVVDSDLGKKITLSLETRYEHDNGDIDVANCSLTFEIVPFVIHDVSVNNSTINSKGENEIYGYVGKDVELEFYFDEDDISFYDETAQAGYYWSTEYRLDSISSESTGVYLDQIRKILQEMNSVNYYNDTRYYAKLNIGQYTTNTIPQETKYEQIELLENINTLRAKDEVSLSTLEFGFEVIEVNGTWSIQMIDTTPSNHKYQINKEYKLNFNKATPWYEPEVIVDEDDFLKMEAGMRYILANDLVFEEYSPVDLDLIEFDGNGRKITIKSFAPFEKEIINAGLFAHVYKNMIVKNVVVEYAGELSPRTGYYDLCNAEANYTEALFGGIAATNEGIITNCHVQGSVKLRASVIEQKKNQGSSGYDTSMYLAGLVVNNIVDSKTSAMGYITNSTSSLEIYSQANIAGLVYSNMGKIVASGVINADIDTYNKLENTIIVRVAGFVVDNSGEISMSYVKLEEGSTISAKDVSAGFVYSNTGNIFDAYVSMKEIGHNNNVFAGFVYSNTGTITRAFTDINKGVLNSSVDSMFAPKETKGLTDCIAFVNKKETYNILGLTQVLIGNIYSKNVYVEHNFAFGDNESAVWSIVSGSIPTLVSETEIAKYIIPNGESGKDTGLLTINVIKKEIDDTTGVEEKIYEVSMANYGTKTNPYIINSAVDVVDKFGNIIIQNTWQMLTGEISHLTTGKTIQIKEDGYFRIVKDIDFAKVGTNPETFQETFKGNIQGNNMVLSNIMLYSESELEAIGLFKKLEGSENSDTVNAVRNLKLTTTSVWASKTKVVGLLAGVIENFNLYNITVDSPNMIMVGGNAVGGVAGVIRGKFNIDSLTSNIGANSNRATNVSYYSIYMGTNNKLSVSENLSNVYYAGSVAGILDGYDRIQYNVNDPSSRNFNKYFQVKHINVGGKITLLGDIVGSAFGFVGERTYVSKVKVDISGSLAGQQFSGVVAGENRGVIDNKINNTSNVKIQFADDLFANSVNTSAGVAGINIGGLVMNVDVVGNIKLTGSKTAGGIVGKNIAGVVANTYFDGEIYAYIAGGAVAADYTSAMMVNKDSGNGILSYHNRSNRYLLPNTRANYSGIKNYSNISFSANMVNSFIHNIKNFYMFEGNSEDNTSVTLTATRLFGFVVGLSGYSEDTNASPENLYIKHDTLDLENNSGSITFNSTDNNCKIDKTLDVEAKLIETQENLQSNKAIVKDELETEDETPNVSKYAVKTYAEAYVLNIGIGDYEIYLVGAYSGVADSWNRKYSNNFIVLKVGA